MAWISLCAIALAYLGVLAWSDSKGQTFSELPRLARLLPILAVFSIVSWCLRYLRWWWLMRRTAIRLPVVHGFLAYLSGFAFTASPGKVGELVRIRYMTRLGASPERVFGAFVWERLFDLIVVALLSCLYVMQGGWFLLGLGFTAVCALVVALIYRYQARINEWAMRLMARGLGWPGRALQLLSDGIAQFRLWANPVDVLISLACGLAAWSTLALAFSWLCSQLAIELPTTASLAIYPLSMLVGAASGIPGGVGSTEAVAVALLTHLGAPLNSSIVAAVGIRLASLWFAIAVGMVAGAWLEYDRTRRTNAQEGAIPTDEGTIRAESEAADSCPRP